MGVPESITANTLSNIPGKVEVVNLAPKSLGFERHITLLLPGGNSEWQIEWTETHKTCEDENTCQN